MNWRTARMVTLALASLLALGLLAGCGDDDADVVTSSPTQGPTPTPAVSDVPGSKDFTGIPRYTGSVITAWTSDPEVVDCEEGPVEQYGRWTTEYDAPAGTTQRDIVTFYTNELVPIGWATTVTGPTYLYLVKGTNVGDLECNPDGRQDHITIETSPFACTALCTRYTVKLLVPLDSEPY